MAEKEPVAGRLVDVVLQPWSDGDLPLLEKLLGDPGIRIQRASSTEALRRRQRALLISAKAMTWMNLP